MDALFLKLLNMSWTAALLTAVVVVLRLALKRAPKWARCLLWALVAVRLLCPVSIASPLSAFGLLGAKTDGAGSVAYFEYAGGTEKPLVRFDTVRIERAVTRSAPGADTGNGPVAVTTRTVSRYLPPLEAAWLAGAAVMLLYALWSWLRLRRRVSAALRQEDGVFVCDDIGTPFILGLVRPRIYLPSGLAGARREHVLAHERAHLARRDHWWKPLGWLLLSVHWFNPALWLAYVLLCRDIELACDERVYRTLGQEERADYSQALLDCSRARHIIAACPLAFGEVGVKARVKAALNYKRPAFWLVLTAVVVCIAAAVCFLTDPKRAEQEEPAAYQAALAEAKELWYEPPAFSDMAYPFPVTDGELTALKPYLADVEATRQAPDLSAVQPIMTPSFTLKRGGERYLLHEGYLIRAHYDSETAEAVCTVVGKAGFTTLAPVEQAARGKTETITAPVEQTNVRTWVSDDPPEAFDWNANMSLTLSELPGVTFTYTPGEITIRGEGRTFSLPGMPIWNAFFTDLNGDGVPELCATLSIGSGVIDDRIAVYDAANWVSYELSGRMEYDYRLSLEDGELIVSRYVYADTLRRAEAVGRLAIEDGKLIMADVQSLADQPVLHLQTDDLDGDGQLDIVLVNGSSEYPQDYTALISTAGGTLLYEESFNCVHPGWGALYLCRTADGPRLLRYLPAMYQGIADYRYEVLALTGGRLTVEAANEVNFDMNKPATIDQPALDAFSREVNAYLADATLLISTIDGRARSGTADESDFRVNVYAEADCTIARDLRGVMGYEGYWVQEEIAPFHYLRTYYGMTPGGAVKIAESFGFTIDDRAVDLDGDGVKELVCNCVYGADGVERVFVFRRNGDSVERGWFDTEKAAPADWENWGVSSWRERWDDEAKAFVFAYDTAAGERTRRSSRLDGFVFEPYPGE